MNIRHWISVFAVFAAAAGCGSTKTVDGPVYNPGEFHGFVDQSLPPAQVARQQALYSVLEDARAGCKPEDIKKRGAEIDFRETTPNFLENGAKLERWKFAGKPQGDSVGVVLFVSSGAGGQAKEIHRTYRVAQQRGKFTITRA